MSTADRTSVSPTSRSESTYETLKVFFGENDLSILELEILPSSYPFPAAAPATCPVLQDGSSLAVPKKALAQAFFVARETLFDQLKETQPNEYDDATGKHDSVDSATKVILLFDPEHLTAANWRKQHLKTSIEALTDNLDRDSAGKIEHLVQRELAFISSLLTSPLHRHAKSPTLWHHRLWIVRTYYPYFSGGFNTKMNVSATSFFALEIDIVVAAASRHKANYYAWQYGRRLLRFLEFQVQGRDDGQESEHTTVEIVKRDLVKRVHKWCLAQPSDISGWVYLDSLIWQTKNSGDEAENHLRVQVPNNRLSEARAVIQATEDFVQDIGWTGKSVEWFLKSARLHRKAVKTA
ncbi:hypothetical protein MMC06_003202 [Schaereria dolodes]|nr:hypothetical protein [Schaereria dolodes]